MTIVKFNFIEQKIMGGGISMSFNYSKLLGRITEKYGTQYNFAKAMGMSEHSLSVKLNNKIPWKTTEIVKATELLNINTHDIPSYFFMK